MPGWETLSVLQQIFLYTAIPFSVVLLIQAVITLIGLGGGGDTDADADTDADGADISAAEHDAGFDHGGHIDAHEHDGAQSEDFSQVGSFKFFTIRGIVAFFCVFGWTGFALDPSLGAAPVLFISFGAGLLAMLLIGLMFYAVRRLQSSGNIRYSNAAGKTAEVYIPIPAGRGGKGKVMVEIQERLVEAEAITDEDEKLKTGETVRVTGNTGNTLIVMRRKEK